LESDDPVTTRAFGDEQRLIGEIDQYLGIVRVGKSLCEHDLADTANAILDAADAAGCTVHLPYDVVVATEFRANPPVRTVNVHEVAADEMILDVGPAAASRCNLVLHAHLV